MSNAKDDSKNDSDPEESRLINFSSSFYSNFRMFYFCFVFRVEVHLEPMDDDDKDVAMRSQPQTVDRNPFASLHSEQQQRPMDVDSGIVTTMEVDDTDWGQRVIMFEKF